MRHEGPPAPLRRGGAPRGEAQSSMIILGVFTAHDAGAALFDDYRMIAAVSLERLTRMKSDGDRFPDEAIDDCLASVGLTRADVDVLCLPRASFPAKYFPSKPWWDLRPKR